MPFEGKNTVLSEYDLKRIRSKENKNYIKNTRGYRIGLKKQRRQKKFAGRKRYEMGGFLRSFSYKP